MATRKNTFLLKRSNQQGKVPSAGDLLLGELALNTADVILYASGTTTNSILPIGWDRIARTGDTISGTLYVTTISATTYQNLPTDIRVTGGTYSSSSSTIIFTNNTGGTFNVTGITATGGGTFTGGTVTGATIFTNGLSANTISATTYYNLPLDITITGGTYSASSSTIIFTNNTGGTFNVTGITATGGGSGDYLPLSGGTVTGPTIFTNGLTSNTITVNGGLTAVTIHSEYLYDNTNSYGIPGQILVSTPTGAQWVGGDYFCDLSNTTTSGLETKTIDTITGFTSGSYIVKSYITSYSGTSRYGFWERTLGVVTSGGTPISSIITQNFDDYSNGFVPSQIVYTPTTGNTIDVIISGLTGEDLYWESYYDVIGKSCRPIVNVLPSANLGSFGLTIGNGSSVITTGQKGFIKMPYPGTITDWTIISETSGSVVMDIWKDTYVNFPPTSADTITGNNYPYLASQSINTDNVLSGWTKDFLVNDVFVFNILSADTVTSINLTINVIKT